MVVDYIILRSRDPAVAFLTDADATTLIDSLGLGEEVSAVLVRKSTN